MENKVQYSHPIYDNAEIDYNIEQREITEEIDVVEAELKKDTFEKVQ